MNNYTLKHKRPKGQGKSLADLKEEIKGLNHAEKNTLKGGYIIRVRPNRLYRGHIVPQ